MPEPTVITPAKPGVPAHIQHTTLRLEEYVPYHPTREDDPYYHLFNQVRNRLKRQGLLKCGVCGTMENIELHHNEVEFSMAAGVDVSKFADLHPDIHIENDDDFARFVESEHNLSPYCRKHHTGMNGIHVIPYPLWQLMKYWDTSVSEEPAIVKGEES